MLGCRGWGWRRRGVCFLLSLALSIGLGGLYQNVGLGLYPAVATVQELSLPVLVEQGVDLYQQGDFQGALQLWQRALEATDESSRARQRAVVLENLARTHRQMGQNAAAVDLWQQASDLHRQWGDWRALGRSLTEQAQAYSALGQHRRAIALLCGEADHCSTASAVGLATAAEDEVGRAAALGSLGEALRLRGDYEAAIAALDESLAIARQSDQFSYQISALNSLGTVHIGKAQVLYRLAESATLDGDVSEPILADAIVEDQRALAYFAESQALAIREGDRGAQLRSQLSQIPIYHRLGQSASAQTAQVEAAQILSQLPNGHDTIFAAIALANLIQFGEASGGVGAGCFARAPDPQVEALLTQAIERAQALADGRGEAFALGTLGHWYECQRNYPQALALTQRAEWLTDQQLAGEDSRYLWEWQRGRIHRAQGKGEAAIQAYTQAVATLEAIRNDLLVSDRELQFDFRDSVEPIYRELIALQLGILETTAAKAKPVPLIPPRDSLVAALTTVDALRLAELQNYFGSDCEIIPFAETPVGLVGADSATAVFTSVILGDRTAIIVSFPDGSRQAAWVPVDEATLRVTIRNFRQGLESWFNAFDPGLAEQVYDWLIRPFSQHLSNAEIRTLVFVNDGILRSVPMAALYDGEKFLVETYALATVPTLSLTATRSATPPPISALVAGMSESVTVTGQSFKPLPHVRKELSLIQDTLPRTTILLDRDFTPQRLGQELTDGTYTVLHMATHAKFGVQPEDTFLVTGSGEKMTLADLEQLVGRTAAGAGQIDLLTLTACETGIGDDRSALGLGGVAVRAGVNSAIATLWSIDDAQTAKLSAQFYQSLVSGQTTKAKALQVAQLSLIQAGMHPAYWAPFILVGNWL